MTFYNARALAIAARQVLKPPPRLNLSEWADAKYRLSADAGAAEPGRWKTLPFQRGWMDALTDPRTWQVSVMKAARVGWTESIKAFVGYHVDHDPSAILLIQPTENDAKGFSKESIEPLLRDVPDVGDKFARYTLKNTLLLKRYRGGILQIASARKPGDFRRVGRRIVAGDEVDGYPLSTGKEGDAIKLASKRADYFWNRKLLWGSTPTIAGVSRIEQLFLDGNQQRYYVPCPKCGEFQVLQFRYFDWPKGKPEAAVYLCRQCSHAIDHSHKRDMVHAGEWRPGPHAQFTDVEAPPEWHGHASFHIWAAYSFSPNASWGQLCTEWVAATHAGAEQLQTVVNTMLGETWKEKGEAPEWRRLFDRRESYAIGSCPMGVRFLTVGTDIQHDRIVYEVVGFGRNKESWSIDAGVIQGDTANLGPKGPWPQLAALLEREFPHESGTNLRVRMLAADSGDQTITVYSWVRSQEDPGRVIAVKGIDSADVVVNTGSKVDVTRSGKRVGWVRLFLVGKAMTTSEFYGWVRQELPTEEERANGAVTPTGYCHFPQYPESVFKELTALQLVSHKNPKGFMVRTWELIPGRSDDFLSARRYARSAAALVGLDRLRESDWEALEQQLGLETKNKEQSLKETSESFPETSGKESAAPSRPAPKQQPWLGRRRGGWLKGDR